MANRNTKIYWKRSNSNEKFRNGIQHLMDKVLPNLMLENKEILLSKNLGKIQIQTRKKRNFYNISTQSIEKSPQIKVPVFKFVPSLKSKIKNN